MIDSSRSDNEHITAAWVYHLRYLPQLVGLLSLNIGVRAELIYQSQNAQGVPHFSDRPRHGGSSHRLMPAKSFGDLARQHLESCRITNDIEVSKSKKLDD